MPFNPNFERTVRLNTSQGDGEENLWNVIEDHVQGFPADQCTVDIELVGSSAIETEGIPTYSGLTIRGIGTGQPGNKPVLKLKDNATKDLFITPDDAQEGGGSGSYWYPHHFRIQDLRLDGNMQNQTEPRNLIRSYNGGFGFYLVRCFLTNVYGTGIIHDRTPLNLYLFQVDFSRCFFGAVELNTFDYANGGFAMQYGQIDNCGTYPIYIRHNKTGSPIHSAAQYSIMDYKFEVQTNTQGRNRTVGIEFADGAVRDIPLPTALIGALNNADQRAPIINLERLTASTWINGGKSPAEASGSDEGYLMDSFIREVSSFSGSRPCVFNTRSISARGQQIATVFHSEETKETFATEPGTPPETIWAFNRVFGVGTTTPEPDPVDPPPTIPTETLPEKITISSEDIERSYTADDA